MKPPIHSFRIWLKTTSRLPDACGATLRHTREGGYPITQPIPGQLTAEAFIQRFAGSVGEDFPDDIDEADSAPTIYRLRRWPEPLICAWPRAMCPNFPECLAC
jgi:hypothetical protein